MATKGETGSVQMKSTKTRKRPANPSGKDDNEQSKKSKRQSGDEKFNINKKKFLKNDSPSGKKKTPFPKKKSFGNFKNKQADSNKKTKNGASNLEDEEKPNIWQMKKKERKEYRKKHDAHYNLIHSIKQHYESLRRKDVPEDEKFKLIDEILKLIAGHTHEVIFKHDTGRVMQCCVKYGNSGQRKALFMQFKDDLEAMIKSKYSKFFVKKMLKYGTKEQRSVIIKCFYGKVKKLIKHKEASEILETIYTDYAVAAQKSALVQEFYGPEFALFKTMDNRNLKQIITNEPEKKADILKNLKESLNPLVDRSVITHNIVHRVLLEYLTLSDEKSRSEMIESIRECVVLILHTHDGARVAMQCLWNGTAKERKIILKTFKTYIVKICKEEYGHMVLLSLFDVVDDTVLVKKIVFPEIIANLKELAMDTYGCKVLLYILMPRAPTHFHPDIVKLLEKGDDNPHSKKDSTQRRQELLDGLSPSLLELVRDNGEELMFDKGGCQLVLAILLKCSGDLVPAMTAISKAAGKQVDPSTNEEDHLIKSASGHFALKRLILQDKERLEKNHEGQTFFSKQLLENVERDSLFNWCKVNRGAFVITSLLESPVPGIADKVNNILKPKLKKLEKYESKGVEIILKILNFRSISCDVMAAMLVYFKEFLISFSCYMKYTNMASDVMAAMLVYLKEFLVSFSCYMKYTNMASDVMAAMLVYLKEFLISFSCYTRYTNMASDVMAAMLVYLKQRILY